MIPANQENLAKKRYLYLNTRRHALAILSTHTLSPCYLPQPPVVCFLTKLLVSAPSRLPEVPPERGGRGVNSAVDAHETFAVYALPVGPSFVLPTALHETLKKRVV